MAVEYGTTVNNLNIIMEKARFKKDGVYSFKCIFYRVRDKRITHIAYDRKILANYGSFNIIVGTYAYPRDAVKLLTIIGR